MNLESFSANKWQPLCFLDGGEGKKCLSGKHMNQQKAQERAAACTEVSYRQEPPRWY